MFSHSFFFVVDVDVAVVIVSFISGIKLANVFLRLPVRDFEIGSEKS